MCYRSDSYRSDEFLSYCFSYMGNVIDLEEKHVFPSFERVLFL